jgi:hypothetical protein
VRTYISSKTQQKTKTTTIFQNMQTVSKVSILKYDKQDQQGNAAFNKRNPHTIQQQEPVARSPGGPQIKTGQGTRQSMGRLITTIIHKKK